MKIALVFITIILGAIADTGLISRHWLPASVRPYLFKPKFEKGQCLMSPKRWGNRKKLVINYKDGKTKSGYLLQDRDRHEHYQYLSRVEVEKYAQVVNCPRG